MKSIHILMVEDNEGDILLTSEALKDSSIINTISVVKNGKDAIDFIFKKNSYKDVETPDLILLDVNLPLKNGHEVLQIVKDDDNTKNIPVIMFTTSSSEKDVGLSYKYYANCYIVKPVEANQFVDVIANIENFWFNIVKLPAKN